MACQSRDVKSLKRSKKGRLLILHRGFSVLDCGINSFWKLTISQLTLLSRPKFRFLRKKYVKRNEKFGSIAFGKNFFSDNDQLGQAVQPEQKEREPGGGASPPGFGQPARGGGLATGAGGPATYRQAGAERGSGSRPPVWPARPDPVPSVKTQPQSPAPRIRRWLYGQPQGSACVGDLPMKSATFPNVFQGF